MFFHLGSGQGEETCDQRTDSNRQKGTEWEGQRTGKQNEGGNLGWLPFASRYILEHLIIAVKCFADIVSKALQKGDEVKGSTHLEKSLFYVVTPHISLVIYVCLC